MSTHKTADLTGPLLDAAVALAQGIHPYNFRNKWCLIVGENEDETVVYEPSVDWEQAGPIIERERIAITPYGPAEWHAFGPEFASAKPWSASAPLVAAMRAYVFSKFGDEVELP